MNLKISYTPVFRRQFNSLAKKYSSLPSNLEELVGKLSANPHLGTALGHGIYKIRLTITSKGKGKSAGARVITY